MAAPRSVINLLEELVWEKLDEVLPRIGDACRCEQCRLDIYTLSLNRVPPHYVTGRRAFDEILKVKRAEYGVRIVQAIEAAVVRVRAKPRSECAKMGFWVQTDRGETLPTEFEGPRAQAGAVDPLAGSSPLGPPPAPELPSAPVRMPTNAAAAFARYGQPNKRRY